MKRIVIIGGGESGVGAALLAKKKGYEVFLSDNGPIKQKYKGVLLHNDIEWEENKHSEGVILSAQEVVKSPGIPDNILLIQKIKRKKISIVSEIEFAARFSEACLIGITGTNGKTTTASLIYHIFKNAAYDVCLAGNVGRSFAWALSERDYKYFVLELSSFQLDNMYETKLNAAVLLNITPDHLDRYKNFKKYALSKWRIIQNQTQQDCLIYNYDDERIIKNFKTINPKSECIQYSINKRIEKGAFLNNSEIVINYNKKLDMQVEEIALAGKHNIGNSMAAALMAQRHNIRNPKIRESLGNYVNVEHRMEFVSKIRGVEYINDSKATNINAVWYALENCALPVIWIAGGIDKGNNYLKLKEVVRKNVKCIVCIGADNTNIINAFKNDVEDIIEASNMTDAVELSYKLSAPGNIVLLSPACSSFDKFENFEDRGRQFKNAVMNL